LNPYFFRLSLLFLAVSLQARTPASLAQEIDRLHREIDRGNARSVLAGLPAAWDVETAEARYSISTAPLRERLAKGDAEAEDWLSRLAENLEQSSEPGPPSASGSLDKILARPEFAAERPPSAWTLFLRRIAAWIQEMLARLLGYAEQHPTASKMLFWVVLVGAVFGIAAFVARLWMRDEPLTALPKLAAPLMETRTWEQWIAAARQAGDQGDLHAAIRYAYWAGIARLQEVRVLPMDLRHTPRECLRMVPADGSGYRAPLSSLTSSLERFWYAHRPAGPDDLRESLNQLEALGCKVD
jgi:Domain of unknown function (DUF4129)